MDFAMDMFWNKTETQSELTNYIKNQSQIRLILHLILSRLIMKKDCRHRKSVFVDFFPTQFEKKEGYKLN